MEQYNLEKLYIENYRSYNRAGIEDISNFNIIIGPNNSGKSNIFRLLKASIGLLDYSYNYVDNYTGISFNVNHYFKEEDYWDPKKPIKLILFFNQELSIILIIEKLQMKLYIIESGRKVKLNNFEIKNFDSLNKMLEDIKLSFNFFDDLRGSEDTLSGLDIQRTILEEIDRFECEEDGRKNAGYFSFISYRLRRIIDDKTVWIQKNFIPGELEPSNFKIKEHIKLLHKLDEQGKKRLSQEHITLNLGAVGSGVSQIVSLLTVVFKYRHRNSKFKLILLLEEPEQNLHPEAIVRLFNEIIKECSIQFIINTHSPWLIDKEEVTRIYSISKTTEEGSIIKLSTEAGDIRSLLDLIGARPSQLLQSNLVFWVEGPSDRLYINGWLKKSTRGLVEGKHYSFVMFGGSLLSHYGYDNDDLINILSTSRYAILVSDLDRENPDEELKERLKKWEDRLKDNNKIKENILLWKTDYKEIENYIPHEEIINAIKKVKMQKSVRVDGKTIDVTIKENSTNFNLQKESFTDYFSHLYVYDLTNEDDASKQALAEKGIKSNGKLLEPDRIKIRKALNSVKIDIARVVVNSMNRVPSSVQPWMREIKKFLNKAN